MPTRFERSNRQCSVVGIVATTIALACPPGVANACSVPVFRYALDHWLPDAFRIRILHQGPLSDEDASLARQLKEQAVARFSNVTVEEVDLQQVDDPELLARFEESNDSGSTLCFIQGPTGSPDEYRDVWSGPLTSETVDAVLGSPIREQLAQQLLAGTSVVWIYLESGDAAIDDANDELLKSSLAQLEGELELPEIDEADLKELSTSPEDVKLKFSSVRVSRSDPQEALLVEMLLASEPDLRDPVFVNEPMAFPVFGRGRVLYSLVGKGITPGLIEDACRFLTGACQCTVKAQNPGVDLLLSVDWDGLISPTQPAEVEVTLTGLAGFQSDSGDAAASAIAADAADTAEPAPETEVSPAAVDAGPVPPAVAEPQSSDDSPARQAVDDAIEGTIQTRPDPSTAPFIRPGVLIAILGLLVVVGSFFLIPRR